VELHLAETTIFASQLEAYLQAALVKQFPWNEDVTYQAEASGSVPDNSSPNSDAEAYMIPMRIVLYRVKIWQLWTLNAGFVRPQSFMWKGPVRRCWYRSCSLITSVEDSRLETDAPSMNAGLHAVHQLRCFEDPPLG
jgi:hypothetical protein